MRTSITEMKAKLLVAITPHVAFDGWSPVAFEAAIAEAGVSQDDAHYACPRGAIDLAVAAHKAADNALAAAWTDEPVEAMKYSEKVARAIELRLLLAGEKEAVRRATALFALPHMAVEGAALIWGSADAIWTALGDTSRDFNWYSKRATLSGVYGSCVLYWLGDQGDGEETRAFIDRRIGDVMRFEKFKSDARGSKVLGPLAQGIERMTKDIRAPGHASQQETK